MRVENRQPVLASFSKSSQALVRFDWHHSSAGRAVSFSLSGVSSRLCWWIHKGLTGTGQECSLHLYTSECITWPGKPYSLSQWAVPYPQKYKATLTSPPRCVPDHRHPMVLSVVILRLMIVVQVDRHDPQNRLALGF